MARVFVSHSGKDAALADAVHRWLVDDGHEAFLDRDLYDGIRVGEQWERRLHERLRWADAMVCVLTSTYVASVWCTAELAVARSRGSRVLPVRAEAAVDHPLVKSLQHVDMIRDAAVARAKLAEALLRLDAAGGSGWPDDRSPFPGLRALDTDEHLVFFGRSHEVDQLATVLRSPAEQVEHAVLLVVGPSGCGKSSLVRAGLLPVMAADEDWWTLAAIRPSRQPLAALARELAASAHQLRLSWTVTDVRRRLDQGDLTGMVDDLLLAVPGRRRRHLLMVVDQFEELLTQTGTEERTRFVQLLQCGLAGPMQVVATLRPEFLDQLLSSPDLAGLPTRTQTLRPLRPEALHAVIEGPADRAGITVDHHLVTRLVADTGSGEALPLLAYTLAQLADGVTRGGRLSAALYEKLGEVGGVLAGQADAALAEAVAAGGRDRNRVIRELLRLVTVDELGRPTRWRIRRNELPDQVLTELQPFIDRRLLVTDTEHDHVVLGVAHEAFLSAWPPLSEAITAAASALRARRRVEQAAAEWAEHGHAPTRLWERGQLAAALADTGARLRPAHAGRSTTRIEQDPEPSRRWPSRHRTVAAQRVELSAQAWDFLRASSRRARRRVRGAFAALIAALTAISVVAVIAVDRAQEAARQRDIAVSRQLAANATNVLAANPSLSLALAMHAYTTAPTAQAEEILRRATAESREIATLGHGPGSVYSARLSADGQSAVSTGADGTLRIWDVPAKRMTDTIPGHDGIVTSVRMSPDGRQLASSGADGTVALISIPDHQRQVVTRTVAGGYATSVDFAPDGRLLAASLSDGTVRMIDAVTGRETATLQIGPDTVTRVSFSPDGSAIVTAGADGTAQVWDVAAGTRRVILRGHAGPVTAAVFHPSGTQVFTSGADGTVRTWDVATGALARTMEVDEQALYAVAVSPDGRRIATAGEEGLVRIWATAGVELAAMPGHLGAVFDVSFDAIGHRVISSGKDGTARIWDPGTDDAVRLATTWAAYSPDGRRIVVGGADGHVRVLSADDLAPQLDLTGHVGRCWPLFSPDGKSIASAGEDGTVRVWNALDGSEIAVLRPHRASVWSAAFDLSSDWVLSSADDGTIVKSSLDGRSAEELPAQAGAVNVALLSPDGSTVASAGTEGTIQLWSPGRQLRRLRGHDGAVGALAFNRNGSLLASAGADGTVRVWRLRDGAPVAVLRGHEGPARGVDFAADGRLTSVGDDGTLRVWDVAASQLLVTLPVHAGPATTVDVSPDGQARVTVSEEDQVLKRTTCQVCGSIEDVLELARQHGVRQLTPEEKQRYVS